VENIHLEDPKQKPYVCLSYTWEDPLVLDRKQADWVKYAESHIKDGFSNFRIFETMMGRY